MKRQVAKKKKGTDVRDLVSRENDEVRGQGGKSIYLGSVPGAGIRIWGKGAVCAMRPFTRVEPHSTAIRAAFLSALWLASTEMFGQYILLRLHTFLYGNIDERH